MDDHVLNECFSESKISCFETSSVYHISPHYPTLPHMQPRYAEDLPNFKSCLLDKRLEVTICFFKNTSMASERYYLLNYEALRVRLFNNNSCLTQPILHIDLDQGDTKSTQTFPIICQKSYMTCFRHLHMITIYSLKT
jgi:hypothetical protein